MNRIFNTLAILAAAAGFTACEDVIDLEVPNGKVLPVVDAWLTDEAGPQSIRITETVPYTSQAPAPVVKDAVVTLTDLTDNKTYAFTIENDNKYTHDPGPGVSIGKLNHAYKLRIELKGQVYEAIDTIKRIPEIDSITYEFKTKENSGGEEDGYFAKFHARDLGGGTDYYWIRSYRNERSNPITDGFAIDGSFSEYVSDSSIFIIPIAEGITRWDKPFKQHETVIVRLASLTKETHAFLVHVNNQRNNGGLFARILENVRSNLKNTNTANSERVLGWFGASSVRFKEKKIE
jgi:hypothetical protein